MQRIGNALILIILGLIVIAFPLLGVISFSVLTGLTVLFLGLGLLFMVVASMAVSTAMGIVEIILGA